MKRTTIALILGTLTFAGLLSLPVLAKARQGGRGGPEAAWMADGPREERGGFFGGGAHRGPGGPEGMGGFGPGGPGGHGGPAAGLLGQLGPKVAAAMFPFWEHEEITEDLDLTPEQVKALQESHDLMHDTLDGGKGSVRKLGRELKAELEKDNPDLAAVKKINEQLTADIASKSGAVLAHVVTVKTILTEEQETQLRKSGREFARERAPQLGALREEIRETIRQGGTLADVEAIVNDSDLPEKAKERILEGVKERLEEAKKKDGKDSSQ